MVEPFGDHDGGSVEYDMAPGLVPLNTGSPIHTPTNAIQLVDDHICPYLINPFVITAPDTCYGYIIIRYWLK